MPNRVIGVIAIDTLHDVDLVPPRKTVDELAANFERDFGGTMRVLIRGAFLPDADPAAVDWVTSRAVAVDPKPVLAIFRDFPNLDLKAMLRSVKVPIRCINSAPHPGVGPAVRRLRRRDP